MPNMFDVTSPRLIALPKHRRRNRTDPNAPIAPVPTQQLNTHNALPDPDIHG